MSGTITKTAIVTQFGSHYIPEGQNESRLLSQMRQKSATTSYAKSIIYDGEVYRFANTRLGEIVQQFQKKFTPKGTLEFIPNEIRLRNIKMDLSLYPDEVKGSWLGFLQDLSSDERKNWPIVRFLLEKEVIPQLGSDMELKAYFKGIFEAPVTDQAGTTAKVIDGIKSLLIAGLASTTQPMQSVVLSAGITKANAFDLVEEFVESFDPLLEGTKMRVYMDPKILRWYHQDKRNSHGSDVNYNPDKPTIDFSTHELIGLPSMAGEKYLWSTPVDNFLYIRRQNGMKKPKIEESKREVFLMADWWEGLGFGHNELVYVASWA